jgi:hypothetical protein
MLLLILLVGLGCAAYIGIGRWLERRASESLHGLDLCIDEGMISGDVSR